MVQSRMMGPGRAMSHSLDSARMARALEEAPGAQLASVLERYFDRLWPINRSIAGPGLRESLDILDELIPTERLSVPSGSSVFDWEVPDEWHPHAAYVIGP